MHNRVSLNKVMLNIQAPGEQGLKLNKGEILKGQVQAVKDNGLVLIFLKGKLIEAASEVGVKTGQQMYLLVDDFKDQRAYLKVLTPDTLSKLENANLSANLLRMGIPAKEDNIILAKKLMQYNLPVTREHLNQLALGVKILGEANAKNLEIAAFALARGIPVRQETLGALAQYINTDSDVSKLVTSIVNSIARLSTLPTGNPAANSAGGMIPPDITGEVQDTNVVSNITVSPDQSEKGAKTISGEAGLRAAQLKSENVAGFYPDNSNTLNKETANTSVNEGNSRQTPVFYTSKLPEQNLEKTLTLIRPLIDLLRMDISDPTTRAEIIQRMQTLIYTEKDLLKSLILIKDLINNDESIIKSAILNDLINNLDSLEKELSGQRLFNYISRFSADNNLNYYYFSFPVQMNNETHLCQLRINKETGSRSISEEDNLNFVVSLSTSRIGVVLFHVQWSKRGTLELQGVVEDKNIADYLDSNINELVNGLTNLGYSVNNLGIKVLQDKSEVENLRLRLEEIPDDIKPFGIDVTV